MQSLIPFLVFCFLFTMSGKAQLYVGEVDLNKIPGIEYIELSVNSYNSTEVRAAIDYGQVGGKKYRMALLRKGIGDDPMEFPTRVTLFNYLYQQGWEIMFYDTVRLKYLLKKRK